MGSDTSSYSSLSSISKKTDFAATKASRLSGTDFSTTGRLYLKGSVVDHVEKLGPDLNRRTSDTGGEWFLGGKTGEAKHFDGVVRLLVQTGKVMKHWEDIAEVKDPNIKDPSGHSNLEVFRRTVSFGLVQDKEQKVIKAAFDKWQKQQEKLRGYIDAHDGDEGVEQLEKLERAESDLSQRSDSTQRSDSSYRSSLPFYDLWQERKTTYNLYRGLSRGWMNDWDVKTSEDFPAANLDAILGWKLARTAGGLLALVPSATEVGDNVVLLEGGSVPFVLRPMDFVWELVGGAYVHGIMTGRRWNPRSCFRFELI